MNIEMEIKAMGLDREWARLVRQAIDESSKLPNTLIYGLSDVQQLSAQSMGVDQWCDLKIKIGDSIRENVSTNEFERTIAPWYSDGGLSNRVDINTITNIYDELHDKFGGGMFPYRAVNRHSTKHIVFGKFTDLEFIEYAIYHNATAGRNGPVLSEGFYAGSSERHILDSEIYSISGRGIYWAVGRATDI